MLACWVEDSEGDHFKKHLARIPDNIWVAEDGIKMQVKTNVQSPSLKSVEVKIYPVIYVFSILYFP